MGAFSKGDPSLTEQDHWYRRAVDSVVHHFGVGTRARAGKGVFVVVPKLREVPPLPQVGILSGSAYPSRPHVPYVQMFAFATSWHQGKGSTLAVVRFQDSFDEPLLQRFTDAVKSVPDWNSFAIPWTDQAHRGTFPKSECWSVGCEVQSLQGINHGAAELILEALGAVLLAAQQFSDFLAGLVSTLLRVFSARLGLRRFH